MKLEKLLHDYETGNLVNKLSKAGDGKESQELLKQSLKGFWQFNDKILVIIITVLIAFIIFLGVLIWKYNSQTTMVISLIAGESGGIYFAINRMHVLYKENIAARMLYQLLQNANTLEEKNKIIDSINEFIKNK